MSVLQCPNPDSLKDWQDNCKKPGAGQKVLSATGKFGKTRISPDKIALYFLKHPVPGHLPILLRERKFPSAVFQYSDFLPKILSVNYQKAYPVSEKNAIFFLWDMDGYV